MLNKYMYALQKDNEVRIYLIMLVLFVACSIVLMRLNARQGSVVKELQQKQEVITQIPNLEVQLERIKGAVDGLVLNGVILNDKAPAAIINGTYLKLADEILGRKLVVVEQYHARLCQVSKADLCIDLYLQ